MFHMFHQSWKNLHPPHLPSGEPLGILVNHFEKNVRCFITFLDFVAIYIGKAVLQICYPFIVHINSSNNPTFVAFFSKVTIYPLLAFKICTFSNSEYHKPNPMINNCHTRPCGKNLWVRALVVV